MNPGHLILVLTVLVAAPVAASGVAPLLEEYTRQGAGPFDAARGGRLWTRPFTPRAGEPPRRCTTCHTADPRRPGRHARTGKSIEAMAPSVNPKRLSDPRKVRKWFKRNCKWTLGRECTPQEKGDLLTYLSRL